MQQTTSEPSQAYLIIQLGSRWTDILRLQPEQPVLVGRSSENQVVVKDERVSRHHAKISLQKGGWVVEDLGSRNGTQVNGQSIPEPYSLKGSEEITVGGCRMTFTHQLAGAFSSVSSAADGQNQATIDGPRADIVNRLSNSQWSTELDASAFRFGKDSGSERWSFFYRLVFDLVQCKTEEEAASIALDRLLEEFKSTAGGVLTLEEDLVESTAQNPSTAKDAKVEKEFKLAVLAARQLPGSSYHRVSDFLVTTILKDKQAVLARNVQDDAQLSVARGSGQREIASSLCAPIRIRTTEQDLVIGLIHIYTPTGQRMLSADDLDLAVGVADNLALAISRLREQQKLNIDLDATRRKVDLLEQQLLQSNELIGNSTPMLRVKQTIQRVGPSHATVLVRGESGSGKELVARAIHQASSRRSGPLVCLNCAALAPSLLESELFGHEKGAFTGATERKIGKFEAANKGTLFLDEVGEMPAELQAKFLRVLEGHPFERLGGNTAIHTDVRVVAATNRDLEEAVQEKLFRSDLYFRLRVVEIMLPPLRQRPDDIPGLVEHFVSMFRQHASRRIAGVAPKAMELLVRHRWPGNVRELRNVIERAVVLGIDNTIVEDDLGFQPLVTLPAVQPSLDAKLSFEPLTLDEIEKAHILGMLEYVQGNKSRAAQLLGIERSTLDRKLKRFTEP
ncbi:MAG: sigma 54-interacting transcriptional regulator [Pirellulales bacterium]